MKIRTSSDWRDALPFELPIPAAEAAPGEPARCAGCGADAVPLDRAALWVVKHRHPNNPAGFVRLYCAAHRPAPPAAAPPAGAVAGARRPAASRAARPAAPRVVAPRKPTVPERVAPICPDCFVEVPPSGTCGMCGQRVA